MAENLTNIEVYDYGDGDNEASFTVDGLKYTNLQLRVTADKDDLFVSVERPSSVTRGETVSVGNCVIPWEALLTFAEDGFRYPKFQINDGVKAYRLARWAVIDEDGFVLDRFVNREDARADYPENRIIWLNEPDYLGDDANFWEGRGM